MNKCLKISFGADIPDGFLRDFVQKHARTFDLEGTARVFSTQEIIIIVVCGHKDAVDDFLDILHKGSKEVFLEDIEIEPFLKDRDYRGVFRVIE